MNPPLFDLVPDRSRARSRTHRSRTPRSGRGSSDDGFLCKHCQAFVSSASFLSGVGNRNHCPYCLWSRHLDLYEAGDRLSACKSPMRPIGLTIKENRKKYGSGRGELMVIHLCIECADVSINRIAADDDPQRLFSVFEQSLRMETALRRRLEDGHILVLSNDETDSVKVQLFGAADHSHLRSVMA
jgi:hypothetical protein